MSTFEAVDNLYERERELYHLKEECNARYEQARADLHNVLESFAVKVGSFHQRPFVSLTKSGKYAIVVTWHSGTTPKTHHIRVLPVSQEPQALYTRDDLARE